VINLPTKKKSFFPTKISFILLCVIRVLLTQQILVKKLLSGLQFHLNFTQFSVSKQIHFQSQIKGFTLNFNKIFAYKDCVRTICISKSSKEVFPMNKKMSTSVEEETLIGSVSELKETGETKSTEVEARKSSRKKTRRNKKKTKEENIETKSESETVNVESESKKEKAENEKKSKPKKLSPNWFVALQILNEEILQKFSAVQV